jgi:hypothetical protein
MYILGVDCREFRNIWLFEMLPFSASKKFSRDETNLSFPAKHVGLCYVFAVCSSEALKLTLNKYVPHTVVVRFQASEPTNIGI